MLPAALRLARTGSAAALLLVAQAAAQGVPEYHVTELADLVEEAFPGVTFPSSRPRGLNQNGDVVGEAALNGADQQAWLYTVEHGIVPLPQVPGWPSNLALDVSERDANGEVVVVGGGVFGVHWDVAIGEAALWRVSTVTGTVLETRFLGTPAGLDDALALAVNNHGQVVGWGNSSSGLTAWKYDVGTQVLETFPFPAKPFDINDSGQVCGGPYRGDLFGNYVNLGVAPGTHSTSLISINEQGWVSGRAGTSISDGAGHFLATVVRYIDGAGWTSMVPVSHLTLAAGMNGGGDFMSAGGRLYLEDQGGEFAIGELTAPEFHDVVGSLVAGINDNQQIVARYGHAILYTPLGVMVIPGDVNGDVQVDLDDLCAFLANPIDLDGDGSVDAADEAWLIDRLAVFGYVPQDCNANGVPDACDIAQGASEDCNANGIPDECDGGYLSQVSDAFDPPIQILQGSTTVDDLLVVGTGVVADVDFSLKVDYRIGQLTVLLSHNGTTVTLIDEPGNPEFGDIGSGQLGYDIVLDDEGTGGPIEDEGNFGSPFGPILSPPSYTPNEPLSAFDGMPMNGLWTVTVITDATYGSVVEEFHGWGLQVTSAPAAVPPCACLDQVQSYCSSTVNSTGGAATISSNLMCSVSDNQLELVAQPVPNTIGLFFYGGAATSLPFGNGLRCVDSGGLGLFRLPAELGTDNVLSHAVDLDALQGAGAITPGSTWYLQAWFRDPAAGGAQFNTSDGLEITFTP